MTPYLLDVNMLMALTDPAHVHHHPAHRWFSDVARDSWATCPITENGFVRIVSNPRYPNCPGDAPVVLELLRTICRRAGHEFWPDDVSLRDALRPEAVVRHAQITDLYLVALAAKHGGKLAIFERRIPVTAVVGGQGAIEHVPV